MAVAYRRDIDGLRAVAVLGIVGYHAFPGLVPGGFAGVDVFFVISGFLITGVIARGREAGSFAWGGFYLRRARRILPALIAVCLTVALAAAWIEMPRQLAVTGAALGASALFGANVLFARSPGYFAPAAQESPLLHLWSLGVEEQFYLLWPLLIALLLLKPIRAARPWLAGALLVLSLAAAQSMLLRGADNAAFFGLPARAWEFLCGGLLSLTPGRPPAPRAAEAAAGAGLVLIAAALFGLNDRMPFPGLAALPACLGTALVLWSGGGQAPAAARLLRARPTVAIGRISYSLYLWHWPLLVMAAGLAQRPLEASERAGLVALSFALAAVTWRWVEEPFRRGPMERPWPRLAPYAVGLAVVLGAGLVLFLTRGLPGRLPPAAREAAAIETRDVNPLRNLCFGHPGPLPPTGCRFGASPDAKNYDVLVWGDSHGDAVTPGVVEWARRRGWSVREATQGGCPPFTDRRIPLLKVLEKACRGTTAEVMQEIAADPKLKLVVLAARWPLYRDAPPFYDVNSPRVGAPGFKARVSSLQPSMSDTLATLAAATRAQVLVIGPVPELTLIPPQCLAQQRYLHGDERRCFSAPAALPLARLRPAEAELRQALAAHPKVRAVFPSGDLCSDRTCVSAMDGRLIYFDDDHLSASGARRLVPGWIDRALKPVDGLEG
jgi:peptidoglycan/LPS O-acetylase OafA/YrhL